MPAGRDHVLDADRDAGKRAAASPAVTSRLCSDRAAASASSAASVQIAFSFGFKLAMRSSVASITSTGPTRGRDLCGQLAAEPYRRFGNLLICRTSERSAVLDQRNSRFRP